MPAAPSVHGSTPWNRALPLAGLTAAFAGGVIVLQSRAELPGLVLPTGTVLILAIAALALLRKGGAGPGWRRAGIALLAGAAAGAGFSYAAWRAEMRLADALVLEWEARDLTVTGVVTELPRRFDQGSRFPFRVEIAEPATARVPESIMLSTYRGWREAEWFDGSEPRPGERWKFTVRLKRPHGHANPGGFDYEAWLLEQGVRATGYVRMDPPPQRLAAEVPGLLLAVERLRAGLRDRIGAALGDAPYAGVIIALAIGDQGAVDAEDWRLFAATGTTHLMSISGLHVTMLASLVAACVAMLWRRNEWLTLRLPVRRAAIAAGWLAALAYTLLAGFGVPAQRTLYMLSVAAVALWLGRATRPRQTLALALLVVLLLDPWAVLSAGFWLSFGAVGVLMMAGAETPAGAGWRQKIGAWGWAQWAVTIGSAPLLVWLFQQVSLVSPLANALAIPLVSLVVTPLAVFGALTLAWLPGTWLLQLAHLVLEPLIGFLDWLAGLPVAQWQQAEPPLWAVGLGLAGVVVLLLPRGAPGRWAGLAFLAPALFPLSARIAPGEARVDLLDVGHGLATVLRTAEHVLVFDTGPRYAPAVDAGERILVPVLRAAGIRAVDMLIVSHQDSDHSGGAASLLRAVPVARSRSSLPDDNELRALLPAHAPCLAGESWEWDGVRFRFLHPSAAEYRLPLRKANHLSCVLRVDAAGRSLLMTGDIEARDEATLLASGQPLAADVLVVPHHGSRSSSTAAFLDAVGAAEVVGTIGYRNRFGHPHPEVMQRYEERKVRFWRTDRDGAVSVGLGPVLELVSSRQQRRRYWHGR